jgi:hypothetical protein
MLASPVGLAGTTEPVEDCAPQPLPAASSHVEASTEVLITTQQVRLSTAAAVGVRRQSAGGGLVGIARRMFATPTRPPRPVKRYGYLENAAMARAMERL